jgi:hypothetical protein
MIILPNNFDRNQTQERQFATDHLGMYNVFGMDIIQKFKREDSSQQEAEVSTLYRLATRAPTV